jgi:hypothetical protein
MMSAASRCKSPNIWKQSQLLDSNDKKKQLSRLPYPNPSSLSVPPGGEEELLIVSTLELRGSLLANEI